MPKTVDVIVKFAGTLNPVVRPFLPNEVFPDSMLDIYNTKTNRELVRIGQTTNTIRFASTNLIAITLRHIKGSFKDSVIGKVFIYGSSSGGRNAIDLAVNLTNENLPIEYVGILDAAFFPNESLNFPDNFFGEPTVIPHFAALNIVASRRDNFFQTLGNHSEVSAFHGRLFTSSMGGKEIHGQINNFSIDNFTTQVRATGPAASPPMSFDDVCHINLTKVATPEVHKRIKDILDSL
jgi:hypothetical protein